MSALLTEKYRTFLAQQFVNGVNGNTTAAYLFVGTVLPWSDSSNVAVSDVNPPVPSDDMQDADYVYWRDMLGAAAIGTGNAQFVIARVNWEAGVVYAQYDDQDPLLFSKVFYVVDITSTPYRVYKCLWNNSGGVSTIAPSIIGTAINPTTTADGYVWKYMYTIDSGNYKFLTTDWMPVLLDATVQNNALNTMGSLPLAVPLVILTPGVGYNAAAVITTTVSGDGSGATVAANGTIIMGGLVSKINLAASGNNYTHVLSINVYQSGVTTQATARAIIPPYPNHGYDPVKELYGTGLMLTTTLATDEGGLLTTANDYRRTGLILNPLAVGGNVATAAFYKQTTDITLSANTGTFNPDDAILNITNGAAPFATVVDVVTVANNHVVRLTSVERNGQTTPFANGDIIKCNSSGVEGTVASVSSPQLIPFSGTVVLVNDRTPVLRSNTGSEVFRMVFPFR
jgi:hypothetical protein